MAQPQKTKVAPTIQELEREELGGVYVVNNTPASARADVVFTLYKTNGQGMDNVFVPAISHPLDLTQQVTRKQLLSASEFRRALGGGQLRLVTEEAYLEAMSDPENVRQVREAMGALNNAASAMIQQERTADVHAEEDAQADQVQPRAMVLIDRLKEDEISHRECLIAPRTSAIWTRCRCSTSAARPRTIR